MLNKHSKTPNAYAMHPKHHKAFGMMHLNFSMHPEPCDMHNPTGFN